MIITLHNIIRAIKYKTEVPTYCLQSFVTVMRCMVWHHLYNLKNVKDTHGGVLLLVKWQAKKNLQLY